MNHNLSIEDLQHVMPEFLHGMAKVAAGTVASAVAFFISNATPSEFDLAKNASQFTGWALALVVIYTLAKVVKHLFIKLEERDAKIVQLHADALKKAETRMDEIALTKTNESLRQKP